MTTGAEHALVAGDILTPRSRRTRAAGGILLALLTVGLVALAAAGVAGGTCPFHDLTGASCLTCGMTRSFAAMGEGDLDGAFHYHLFGPVVFALLAAASVGSLAEALCGRRLLVAGLRRGTKTTVMVLGAMWLVYGIVRMAAELCS